MIKMTKKEWLLLSRYLDGDLSAEQVNRIEERLRSDAEFKQAYERLLHTRLVLRSVPQRKVPHSYTLTASMLAAKHQKKAPQRIWQFSSAAAALVTVIALTLQYLSPRASMLNTASDLTQPEMRVFAAPGSAEATATEEPPIILWTSGGYGMGGGGVSDEANSKAAANPEATPAATGFYGVGGGGGSVQQATPSEEMLAAGLEESAPETAQSAQEQVATSDESLNAASSEPSKPAILGIAPAEERGVVQPETMEQVQTERAVSGEQFHFDFGTIAIFAAIISVLCAVVAFILHRKQHS